MYVIIGQSQSMFESDYTYGIAMVEWEFLSYKKESRESGYGGFLPIFCTHNTSQSQ